MSHGPSPSVLRLNRLRIRLPWLGVPLALWLAHPSPMSLEVGAALGGLGLLVRGWAAGTIVKNSELTTWGPYAHTRNPLYLGSFLMALGVAVATGRPVVMAAVLAGFWVLYRRMLRAEEGTLERLHGEAYRRYRDAVPAFFPRPTPYGGRPGRSFRLRRYLDHREYHAALGLVAIMAVLIAGYVW